MGIILLLLQDAKESSVSKDDAPGGIARPEGAIDNRRWPIGGDFEMLLPGSISLFIYTTFSTTYQRQ